MGDINWTNHYELFHWLIEIEYIWRASDPLSQLWCIEYFSSKYLYQHKLYYWMNTEWCESTVTVLDFLIESDWRVSVSLSIF